MSPRQTFHLLQGFVLVFHAASFHAHDDEDSFLASRHTLAVHEDAAAEVATLEAHLEVSDGNLDPTLLQPMLYYEASQHTTPLVESGVLARGLLNSSRVLQQEHSAFVHVTRHASMTNATIEVEIPTTTTIGWVYACMFVPLLFGWALYELSGRPTSWYGLLLPMTLCAMVVAQDLVNQALSVVMDAPNAITSIQSAAMAVLLGIWSLTVDVKSMTQENLTGLLAWLTVALFFVLYQIFNHLVSYWCSLSERVVITNLCPVFSLILEATVMPPRLQVQTSTGTQCALGCMLMGAVCFGMSYSDFSPEGIAAASFLVVVQVGYRLVQRRSLVDGATLPVPLLAAVDGLFLAVPTTVIASTRLDNYEASIASWVRSSTVMPMLTLSIGAFAGTHVCGLLILRVGSATSYLVFHNFANFMVVTVGIMFFKDGVLGSPLAMGGLIMSLCGGLWYALEANQKCATPPFSNKDGFENVAPEAPVAAVKPRI